MDLAQYRRTTGLTLRACAVLSPLPDVVVTNSGAARDFHLGLGYAPKRFEVIPNGFDPDRFRPDAKARREVRTSLGLDDSALVYGLAARLDPMKDHRTFLRAASLVADAVPEAVFVLAGQGADGGNAVLAGWLDEIGLAPERVRLLGEREDMERLMAALDVLVSSSVGESFPNVVGEAMACAVPCVVTDVGDSASLVAETGLVVPPADASALSRAMLDMAGLGPAGRAALGRAARSRVAAGFSLASAVQRYEALYSDLCQG
jgi:glycosyltransferase involved in cell wall biosynthesis